MSFQRAMGVTLMLLSMSGAISTDASAIERDSSKRAEQRANKASKGGVAEAKYPNAARVEPKLNVSSRLSGTMGKLFKAYDNDQHDKVVELSSEVLNNPKANAFERARAAQVAAYSWNTSDQDNAYGESMKYLKLAIDADALGNDDHYDLMFVLAQIQLQEEQYAEALATVTRFITETKVERQDVYAVQGNALFRLERYAEAADAFKKAMALQAEPDQNLMKMLMASYFELGQPEEAAKMAEALVAKRPNDKALLMNLVNIYLQAEMPQKASTTFDRIRDQGMLTESKDYEFAYKLLANIDGREKDAVTVINEGLEKKILSPSFEVYNFLGQSYYFSEQVEPAIAAWQLAAPMAKDGETYLNLAKVQVQESHYEAGKAAAKQALAKGVKKPGDAWMTIARAEYGDDGANRAAVLAAYREAAKYPETKVQAQKQIAQMSR